MCIWGELVKNLLFIGGNLSDWSLFLLELKQVESSYKFRSNKKRGGGYFLKIFNYLMNLFRVWYLLWKNLSIVLSKIGILWKDISKWSKFFSYFTKFERVSISFALFYEEFKLNCNFLRLLRWRIAKFLKFGMTV